MFQQMRQRIHLVKIYQGLLFIYSLKRSEDLRIQNYRA